MECCLTIIAVIKSPKDVVDPDPGVDTLLLPADHFNILLRE